MSGGNVRVGDELASLLVECGDKLVAALADRYTSAH